MVTRRSGRAGSAQPAPAPSRRSARRQAESSTASSERRLSSEYLAYSSDDEFEQFMYGPVNCRVLLMDAPGTVQWLLTGRSRVV